MGKNKQKGFYSTNPDFQFEDDFSEEVETLPNAFQKLYVSIDRKQRGGKEVTLVEGFIGSDDDLKEFAKHLGLDYILEESREED